MEFASCVTYELFRILDEIIKDTTTPLLVFLWWI